MLRRVTSIAAEEGVVNCYVHNPVAPSLGGIVAAVSLEAKPTPEVGSESHTELLEFAKSLAMQVAAARPESVTVANLPPASVERERAILTEQAQQSGKPADIIAKMVEGRLSKFYEEAVLTEQVYLIGGNGKDKVKQLVEAKRKALGLTELSVGKLAYVKVGDGVDTTQQNEE